MLDGWEFSWPRALLGAAIGGIAGYRNSANGGSALWWLALPLLALVFGWRHESDDDNGTVAD